MCFITRHKSRGSATIEQGAIPKNRGVISQYDFSIPDRQFHGGFILFTNAYAMANLTKRELKMKKIHKLILPMLVAGTTMITPPAMAIMTICQAAGTCQASLSCKNNGGYCCKTSTQTRYTCPTGWTANMTTGECHRAATTRSDAKGTYKQNYGTCQGDRTTQDCYTWSRVNTGGCTMCFQESWQ